MNLVTDRMGRPVGRLSARCGGFRSPPANKLCLANSLVRHERQSSSATFQAPQNRARAPLGDKRTATSPCRVIVTRATSRGNDGEGRDESARAAAEQLTSLQRSLTQLLCVMGNLASAVGEVAQAAGEVAEAAVAERGSGMTGHELALALQRAFVQARIEGLGKPRQEALSDFVDACMAARAQSLGFKDLQLKLLLAEAALPVPFSMMSGAGEEGEGGGAAGEAGGEAGERLGERLGEREREGKEEDGEEGVESGELGGGGAEEGGKGEEGEAAGLEEKGEEGEEERVEGDLDSDDERKSSALKALRGPFLAEVGMEGRLGGHAVMGAGVCSLNPSQRLSTPLTLSHLTLSSLVHRRSGVCGGSGGGGEKGGSERDAYRPTDGFVQQVGVVHQTRAGTTASCWESRRARQRQCRPPLPPSHHPSSPLFISCHCSSPFFTALHPYQTVKAAFDQGRDYNFVRMEQESQPTPVPPSIATLQQTQLLILLALSKGMAATS
ncbi:unnamed protein product [Closterium sp. Yama58-4]|nr:unnamed protein product [Closterium sp. Yama58-4]